MRIHYQNGGAQRFNAIISERTRCLLISGKVPGQFWEHALSTATSLYSRTATRVLGGDNPAGTANAILHPNDDPKPAVGHVKVYGCRSFVNLPQEQRVRSAEYAPRANVGKLIGYQGQHNYFIWLPTERVIVSPSVSFDESSVDHPHDVKQLELLDAEDLDSEDEAPEWQTNNTEFSTVPPEDPDDSDNHPFSVTVGGLDPSESIQPRVETQSSDRGRRCISIFEDLSLDDDVEKLHESQQDEEGATLGGNGTGLGQDESSEPVTGDETPIQSTEDEDTLGDLPPAVATKRRGRPPGSKNKPQTVPRTHRETRSQFK